MLGSRAAAAAAQCWPAGTVQSTHWTDKLEKLKEWSTPTVSPLSQLPGVSARRSILESDLGWAPNLEAAPRASAILPFCVPWPLGASTVRQFFTRLRDESRLHFDFSETSRDFDLLWPAVTPGKVWISPKNCNCLICLVLLFGIKPWPEGKTSFRSVHFTAWQGRLALCFCTSWFGAILLFSEPHNLSALGIFNSGWGLWHCTTMYVRGLSFMNLQWKMMIPLQIAKGYLIWLKCLK